MTHRVAIVGAGMGGLAAAIDLARQGVAVTVCDKLPTVGGKMRRVAVAGTEVDGGPTVFTMRWIFEQLFSDAGASLGERLELTPLDVLARHAWRQGGRLDLYADVERSALAIAEFAGQREADGYRRFCSDSRRIYQTLADTFMAADKPSPFGLVRRVGLSRIGQLWATSPWRRLWPALADYFSDPRLRQLFARYATYCGSSPLEAPATLMLVAHVEQEGVWRVRGGMHEVALALAQLASSLGVEFRLGEAVEAIEIRGRRARGLKLAGGGNVEADAVLFNGDCAALADGRLGNGARSAVAVVPRAARSLSAVTWCLRAATAGFPLHHHNVFFAEDYPREFRAIFAERRITEAPTVYLHAQDRAAGETPAGAERMLMLVNAPPEGDRGGSGEPALARAWERSLALLHDCGLSIAQDPATVRTGPQDFEQLFPATGGALYGRATHGGLGTFARPGSRSRVGRLYLAGGSVHPGAGIPMATLSGRLAARCIVQDLGL
ncbi:MAG: 1-hydroxycarotenoid 3,4-desaturase CrtD [Steroidobacteraceae bacterium]